MYSWSFDGIGTKWAIDIASDVSEKQGNELKQIVEETVEKFDEYYSRFIPDSFVSSLTKRKGIIEVEEDFISLLWLYLPFYHLSNGLFTPLVGSLLASAGYDEQYSFQEKKLQDVPVLTDVVEIVDPVHIDLKQPALFDFGAIGKGFLIDKVAQVIQQTGIADYTVDAGGDIVYKTTHQKELRVGLEHPYDLSKVIGTVNLNNQAICGSAGNRRKWGRFHHIINPKTKESPEEIVAVWVIADRCAIADGLSTCLFFVPPDTLQKQFSFQYLIIKKKGTASYSKDLPITLFV